MNFTNKKALAKEKNGIIDKISHFHFLFEDFTLVLTSLKFSQIFLNNVKFLNNVMKRIH